MKRLLFTLGAVIALITLSNAQTVLLNEGFEENGTMPATWKGGGAFNTNGTNLWEEAVSGSVVNSNVSAYKGNYMAALWDGGFTSCITDLIPPFLNLKTYAHAKLKFCYIACNYFGFDDSLAVFYYIGKHGALQSLPITSYKTVNSNTNPQYDSVTLTIPGGSDSVFVDFRGYYNQDNGIFIDNITITGFSNAGVNNLTTTAGDVIAYPNPTRGIIEIKGEQTTFKTVEIYSMLGQRLQVQNTENVSGQSMVQMDLSNLPGGAYFYKAIAENGTVVSEGKFFYVK